MKDHPAKVGPAMQPCRCGAQRLFITFVTAGKYYRMWTCTYCDTARN